MPEGIARRSERGNIENYELDRHKHQHGDTQPDAKYQCQQGSSFVHTEHQPANIVVHPLVEKETQIVSKHLKAKFVRFLMNNVSFYFRRTINSEEYA
jgi:hypothetical protein